MIYKSQYDHGFGMLDVTKKLDQSSKDFSEVEFSIASQNEFRANMCC